MNERVYTQKKQVLSHLLEFGSITSWEAIDLYGITRLSQYIYLLTKDGYLIDRITRVNSDGKGWHKEYVLIDEGAGNEKIQK